MNNIALRYVYDRKKRATEERPEWILIEARQIGTSNIVYINTGIKLYPKQVTYKNGFTCINHDRASMVNIKVREIFRKVELYAERCTELSQIKDYDKEVAYGSSVSEFINKKIIEGELSTNQLKRHRGLLNHLYRFGDIALFSDLTLENIMSFDTYLRRTIKSQGALHKVHSILRTYIKLAIKLKVCEYNPYDDFEVKKGKSLKEPTFLIEEEIDLIKSFKFDERLTKVRDLFIFQCFTGLSYIDLMDFRLDWVYEVDGIKVFRDARNKTDVGFYSVLLPDAERILQKYYGVLPRYSNQKYNDYLKLIAMACGIKKRITTHVARHTYATYLLNKGVPIASVSKAIGHSSIKQTEHYARLLGKTVISDMKKLL